MTVSEAIRLASERLSKTSDTARLDAELLMAHALGVSRSDLLLGHMSDAAPTSFEHLVERRKTSEPVAYIIGVQEFYGHEFIVSPGVLIPRSDSETLIEAAFEIAPDAKSVLDMGTGSGALLLAFLAGSSAEGIGIDKSGEALKIAQKNAETLGLANRSRFQQADWRENEWARDLGEFDLILCNPPYVETDAALSADVRQFEPHQALFSGTEGMDDYAVLIPQLSGIMNSAGSAILEIGAGQAEAVSAIAKREGFYVELRRDLADRPRALILRAPTMGVD